MAKLSTSARKALPKSDFAVPGRKYPINDPNHARDALSRVSANGTPAQKAEVRAKVHSKYPSIGEKSVSKSKSERSHHGPTEGMQSRGHFKNQGKGEMSHQEFQAMDHGGKHDHMVGRTSKKFEQCGYARLSMLAFLAAIALPLLAFGQSAAPYGVFGGAGSFAQLPGNSPIAITASAAGAASATLTVAWPYAATSELVVWSDGESRTVTFTQASTAITWTGNILTGGTGTALVVDGLTTPPAAGTAGFTSDFGQAISTGTYWLYGGGNVTPTGINAAQTPANITGCGTLVTLTGVNATSGTIKAVATSCTPVIPLPYAPHGWYCAANDTTTTADKLVQSAFATNSCTLTGTVVAADILTWEATPF